MDKPTESIQLFKDFALLVSRVELSLIEECARNFLVDCESYSSYEAEKAFPQNYEDLINDTIEYAEKLQWYIEHRQENTIENSNKYFEKIKVYRKSSLSGLSTLKRDQDSTTSNKRKEQFADLLSRLIGLFNRLLATARDEIQEVKIAQQSNWIELDELSDISIENL